MLTCSVAWASFHEMDTARWCDDGHNCTFVRIELVLLAFSQDCWNTQLNS